MRNLLPLVALSTLACRSAPTSPTVEVPSTPTRPPTPAETSLRARAHEPPRMPRCEASDALTLAPTSAGIAATPALARGPHAALLAWVSVPQGERVARISVLPLDAQSAQPARAAVALLDAGEAPSSPALVARGEGFVLAWRSGAPGQQRIQLRDLDARGVPVGAPRELGARGSVGAPALRVVDGELAVAFAHREGARPVDLSHWAASVSVWVGAREARFAAPPGGALSGEAPALTGEGAAMRVWVGAAREGAGASDEHALLTARLDEANLRLVARDLDHVDARALGDRTLLTWRARVARHDVALRAAVLDAEGESDAPPSTLATFRGAAALRARLAPVGEGLFAAVSLAALADDATASLNLAALDAQGVPLGRAPALASFLARSTELAVAAAPADARDPLTWAVVDGRDSADGHPTLLLTRFGCDPTRPQDRLDVHPPTWVQRLASPEAPALDLARIEASPAAMSCETRGARPFATHVSEGDDALAGTAAAVSITPSGVQLFAVVRTAQGRRRLVTATLDAAGGASPTRTVREAAELSLPPQARPLDTLVPAARRGAGVTVLDGLRGAGRTVALLGRDDGASGEVARTVALARADGLDPFADPLGHPRGAVLLAPSPRDEANALGMLFTDQDTLRRSDIVDGVAREPRSLLRALPGGGALLAGAWTGATRWVALSTGTPDDGRSLGAITLARIEREGVRGATRLFPEEEGVLPAGVALAAQGERVVMVFPRVTQGAGLSWSWADLRCPAQGGAR